VRLEFVRYIQQIGSVLSSCRYNGIYDLSYTEIVTVVGTSEIDLREDLPESGFLAGFLDPENAA